MAERTTLLDATAEVPRLDRLTWPDLHYHTVTGALVLSPSPPRIARMLLYIDQALSRRLKHLAVDEGKTLQRLGVEAFELLLASRSRR